MYEPIFLLNVLLLLVGLACATTEGRWAETSRRDLLRAVLPALFALGLVYSLALHMYVSLGGWPSSIGLAGFPPRLILHAHVAGYTFLGLLGFAIIAWPCAMAICSLTESGRRRIVPLIVFELSAIAAWLALFLTPERFQYWFWD